jgi:hypothetical protein
MTSPETFHLLGVLDKLAFIDVEAFFLDIFRLVLLIKKQNSVNQQCSIINIMCHASPSATVCM